jgi:hypothetical protein
MVELVEESEASIDGWIRSTLRRGASPEDYTAFDRDYAQLLDFLVA